jgi:hypothetical protein
MATQGVKEEKKMCLPREANIYVKVPHVARWEHIPVVPALGRLRQKNHLSSRVQDQPEQHSKTPYISKKK